MLLREVADELPRDQPRRTIVVGGGALLAFHAIRESTVDVDSVAALDAEIVGAARRVATRHGLSVHWLNADATPWTPTGVTIDACEILIDTPTLVVRGLPLPLVFLMKIHALRAKDRADIRRLWELAPYPDLATARAAYEHAYPDDVDEFLFDEVARIVTTPTG